MKPRAFLTAALAGLALLTPLHARAQAPAEDKWTFSLMPYLWLPNFSGKFNYGPPPANGATANVNVDADTILSDLDFAFMIAGEARKGRWLIGTDFIYLDLSSDNSQVRSVDFNPGTGPVNVSTSNLNAGTQSSLKGTVWTLFGGYAAVQDPGLSVDVIGGFRYPGAGCEDRLAAQRGSEPARTPRSTSPARAAWRSARPSGRRSSGRRGR